MSTPEEIRTINEAYFNACNFESLMRGIHFAVYWLALSKVFSSSRVRRTNFTMRVIMTTLITIMFIFSTIHSATYWAYVRRAFIARGETAESTANSLGAYDNWYIGILSISDANAVLADCIIIWRCWIVWGRQWWVVVIPTITTMLTVAFSTIAIYSTLAATTFGVVGVDYATALYSTSLVTTVYCTGFIVYRVLRVGFASHASAGPTSARHNFLRGLRTYSGVVEVVVESSILYAIATLFALVAYIYSGPASEYASAFWTSITGIAPTLLVARVASGESRPDDTWRDATVNLPSWFASGSHSGTAHTSNPSAAGSARQDSSRGKEMVFSKSRDNEMDTMVRLDEEGDSRRSDEEALGGKEV